MTPSMIIDIILTIIIVFLGAIQAYKNAGDTINSKTSYLISEAAKLAVNGEAKMSYVVDRLHATVPVVFRSIITKDKIRESVQSVYDTMKEFARADNGR